MKISEAFEEQPMFDPDFIVKPVSKARLDAAWRAADDEWERRQFDPPHRFEPAS